MKKSDVWMYRISTGLLSAIMSFSALMYFIQHDMVAETFSNLGFPAFIIYPLAIAKILGLVAIWTNKSKMLKEWAYAGFTYDVLLATSAHIAINDGQQYAALFALVLIGVSYFYNRKVYPTFIS